MSSSEEEEEMLVHVEFNGMLEKDVLEQRPVFFKMIGVEGTKPVLQIGNQTFTGEYCDVVGTSLYFEEDPTPPGGDPVFTKSPDHLLRYVCKTRKMLKMSRVFLKKKQSSEDPSKKEGVGKSGLDENAKTRESSEDKTGDSGTSEVTMEAKEDSVLPSCDETNLGIEIPESTSDLETLVEAATFGIETEEVKKIVEEQIKFVTDKAASSEKT